MASSPGWRGWPGEDAPCIALKVSRAWCIAYCDFQVSQAGDPVPTGDDELVLEPVDPEKEKYLQMMEEEILERITDGTDDDLTVNETLAEALEEAIEEITSPTFRESNKEALLPIAACALSLHDNESGAGWRHCDHNGASSRVMAWWVHQPMERNLVTMAFLSVSRLSINVEYCAANQSLTNTP